MDTRCVFPTYSLQRSYSQCDDLFALKTLMLGPHHHWCQFHIRTNSLHVQTIHCVGQNSCMVTFYTETLMWGPTTIGAKSLCIYCMDEFISGDHFALKHWCWVPTIIGANSQCIHCMNHFAAWVNSLCSGLFTLKHWCWAPSPLLPNCRMGQWIKIPMVLGEYFN